MQIQNATAPTQNATAAAHNATVGCVGICNPSDGCDRQDPMLYPAADALDPWSPGSLAGCSAAATL